MTWLGGFEGGLAPGVPAQKIEGFKEWLWKQAKFPGLRLVALHNSAAPNIAQTDATPGGYDQRERNIAVGYKKQGWRGGPAFNVYPDGSIRGGTPWGLYGVHSPSWNNYGIGVEMMADFAKDDDDSGKGLVEKNTACEVIAAILWHQGLPVNNDTVKLHKEDKATTHDCPGKDIEKPDIMKRIEAYYDAFSDPGEHTPEADAEDGAAPAAPMAKLYDVMVDGLNLRNKPSMAGAVIASLPKGQEVKVWSIAKNAATAWAHVTLSKDGGTSYIDGYASASYLKDHAAPASPAQPAQPAPSAVVIPTPADNPHWAMQILTANGLADFRAAAIIGNWMVESYTDLRPWVTGDKIDGVYTAFGIAQWRGARKAALDAFAQARGKSWDDFETQVLYGLHELTEGLEKASGALLMATANVEEATAAAVSSERPAGWHWPSNRDSLPDVLTAARKVSHWDWRLKYAKARLV